MADPKASRLYLGNLHPGISETELEDEFSKYGRIRSIWVARKPPGFAFMEYEDIRDAEDAVKGKDGYKGWKVEFSRRGPRSMGGPPPGAGGGGYDDRGDRGGGGGRGGGFGGGDRGRSPPRRSASPPRRRRSPSYEREQRRRSPVAAYGRDPPPRRSLSPPRRERSRSPAPTRRAEGPYRRD